MKSNLRFECVNTTEAAVAQGYEVLNIFTFLTSQ